jgi:hypothetical protein
MKFRFLRPTILTALALALSACGGSNTFTAYVTVEGLVYSPLVLVDTVSGKEFTITPAMLTASNKIALPLTLEYGDLYEVVIKTAAATPSSASGQPPHQNCLIARNKDTAGRLSEINIGVACNILAPSVGGTITVPAGKVPTGLTINNGGRPAFVATATSVSYAFTAVFYGTSYTPIIAAQPAGLTCTFVPTGNADPEADPKLALNKLSYTGTMGDIDVTVNINCL